jgi:hypothetical protein
MAEGALGTGFGVAIMSYSLKDIFEQGNEFVEKTAASIVAEAEKRIKAKRSANDNNSTIKHVVITPPSVDPFDFNVVGGLMGECARWIFDTSRSPIREFSVMSAIAAMSVFFGRRCVGPTGLGLNIYLVMVAPTGFGKNRPLTAPGIISRSFGDAGQRLIGPTNVTGDSAIERALRISPCLLMPMDEFGLILQGATSRNAPPWTQTISRALLELHSRSEPDATWKAKLTADSKSETRPIEQPTLSILGASTPEEFYDGLTTNSTSNGFLNRLVVISVNDRPKEQEIDAINRFPVDLTERLKAAVEGFPQAPGNLSRTSFSDPSMTARMIAVPYANDGAKRRFQLVQTDKMRMLDSETELAGVAERVSENTSKLATIRAISRNPADPSVSVEDIEWAWAIIHRSIDAVAVGVARYMSGSANEALKKLIFGHIQDSGTGGIPKSILMRRRGVAKATPFELEGVISWLERAGQIFNIGKADSKISRGRSGEKYVAKDMHQAVA